MQGDERPWNTVENHKVSVTREMLRAVGSRWGAGGGPSVQTAAAGVAGVEGEEWMGRRPQRSSSDYKASLNEHQAEPDRVLVGTGEKRHERRRTHILVKCLTSKGQDEKLS